MGMDEAPQQIGTVRVIEQYNLYAILSQKIDTAREVGILAYHDSRNAELQDRTSTHHARAQSCVQGDTIVARTAAGAAKAVHLSMSDRVTILDATVMTGRDDAAVLDQYRSDGDAAFPIALVSLSQRQAKKVRIADRIGLPCASPLGCDF